MRPRHRGSVVSIGAFDGVHLGHQAVLQQLIDKGRELNLPTTVVLFEPLPREYFAPKQAPARLMSFREKCLALRDLGIDRVLRIRFTPQFREMSARTFLERVFVDGLGCRFAIVGDDVHFGKNRTGNFELLKTVGQQHGFGVESTVSLTVDGERVSSTRIRTALEQADFALAEKLLGKPYSISGRVIVGKQLGRTLQAPTANVELRRLRAALSGVYTVEVRIGGRLLQGVANVGTRPTLEDSLRAILEVHILDFDENIYRRTMTVVFRSKIRDEQKFESLDALQQQIHDDIQQAQQYFSSNRD